MKEGNIDFDKLNYFIANNCIDEACEEYIRLCKKIETDISISDEEKALFYSSFAYFLFDIHEYEQSLNMFIRAQNFGYSRNKIHDFIWKAFIEPNLEEFKNTYDSNIEYLFKKGYILNSIDFNELIYWLIPISQEKSFYIYDNKNKSIKGKITFEFDSIDYNQIIVRDQFSDFLLVSDWNINKIQKYVNAINKNEKKAYIIIQKYNEFLSLLQGLRLTEKILSDILIFDGFNNMKEYFKNSNQYIPRNIIELTYEKSLAQEVVDEIHKYRITKQGRRGDKILLSVCMPTYNRGNRAYANVVHSLLSYYDEEIEFIISNNGTKNETKEYYEKIKKLSDSRMNYFEFEENRGFAINLCETVEKSKGKFMLFISDEDFLVLENLHIIMNALKSGDDKLAIVRTKGDGQGIIPLSNLSTDNTKSLLEYTLSSNYISGLILNRNLLIKYNGVNYIKKNLNTNEVCFNYPHMYWELLLCQYGWMQGIDVTLINEGMAEKISVEVERKESVLGKTINIPKYATIESRLKQHKGFLEIFYGLELLRTNFDILRKMYIRLSIKTIFLVSISIKAFYKNMSTSKSPAEMLDTVLDTCLRDLSEIYREKQINKECAIYKNDMMTIEQYYEYFKEELNK